MQLELAALKKHKNETPALIEGLRAEMMNNIAIAVKKAKELNDELVDAKKELEDTKCRNKQLKGQLSRFLTKMSDDTCMCGSNTEV